MHNFTNPDVIAGIILAFYFIAKGSIALFDRKKVSSSSISTGDKYLIVKEEEYKRKVLDTCNLLKTGLENIQNQFNILNMKIQTGEFTCKWSQRDIFTILNHIEEDKKLYEKIDDKLEQILRNI